MTENAQYNLRLFRELITCSHNVYYRTFDMQATCIYSNCPEEHLLNPVFTMDHQGSDGLKLLQSTEKPVVISGSPGFLWIADLEKGADGSNRYIHVIGPVFVEDVSYRAIESKLCTGTIPMETRHAFMRLIHELPVIPLTRFLEYGAMMHYCITEEKINISQFQYASRQDKRPEELPATNRMHGTWAMEQKLLKLIEDGNPEYRRLAAPLVSIGHIGNLANGDSLRHMKNMIIVFTALCTRAAIRGGLDSEIAYTLSDRYIRAIEACTELADVVEINSTMQDDFVHRVHQVKKQSHLSPQIRSCCSYIQVNIMERITTQMLASHAGYSETYLSRKFSREMGMTISEYILSQKIEQAKVMLTDRNDSIQEIAEKLSFRSSSYFGEQFRRAVGMTPGAYRSKITGV